MCGKFSGLRSPQHVFPAENQKPDICSRLSCHCSLRGYKAFGVEYVSQIELPLPASPQPLSMPGKKWMKGLGSFPRLAAERGRIWKRWVLAVLLNCCVTLCQGLPFLGFSSPFFLGFKGRCALELCWPPSWLSCHRNRSAALLLQNGSWRGLSR